MMPMYMNSPQPGQMRPQGGGCCYPHHVAMDASSPASCEHWPTPSPCHGGCVHGNFPSYAPHWPPSPCYHPPQAPYHSCWGNHPGFYPPHAPPCYVHQPFHVGYQQGGFESGNDVTGKNRCTKCSPKNGTGVVIEEHEPESEKRDRGEAVNHVRSSNYPYPIVWLPHENARNQEHQPPPAHVKASESTKVQKAEPKSWNGSFPLDENTLKSLVQNQDRNKLKNGKAVELPFDINRLRSLLQGQGPTQKSKEPGQLQYPILWIPSQGKQEDVEASKKKERGNEESDLKSVSSNHLNSGQIAQCDKGNIEGSDLVEKSLVRNIPVVSYREPRGIPVLEKHLPEPTEKTVKTEPVKDTKTEQRSSPPKASRLPPVCLRVDPLPKRKSGNSKSLSPPRRKEQTLTSEDTNVASPLSSKKVETRTTPESSNVKCEEVNKEKTTPPEGCAKPLVTEEESVETKSNLQGVKCEIVKPCEAKENEEKSAKKTFTEEEAARIIQSRYRGYDVRRWEPIKKLKEIATVREQMGDVKKRVQALELSSGQQAEGKEAVVLGEMVMSLLLKLDSVQGLHPSIRDHRKSLARELSDMQENIDSLKKSSVEKEAEKEQVDTTTSQTSGSPVSLEDSQHAEENNMASDSSPEEHLKSPKNTIDGQLVAEAEEVTGLSETLATAAETCEADSTTIPEKIEGAEALSPIDPSSADGNETTVTNEEDKVVVENLEEALHELPQVVDATLGSEDAIEVSENVANESENEDRKGDDDSVWSSEKIEVVENQSSADGNDMTMTGIDEDKVMVEKLKEPVTELLQVRETALGPHIEDSETVANASENEDRKGEDDYVLPSDKNEAVETVTLADANEVTSDEDQVMVEEPQVVETTHGQAFEGLENATEASDTVANASETEERKGDDESVLPSEKDVESSELPAGVIDDEMQLLSQDSLSSQTVVNPEIASKEETNVDHSSTGIGQETERGMSEETKKLMEENQRFKETMETLLKAGREQLEVISKLTGRVKSLEKKLSQKKRARIGRGKTNRGKKTTKPMPASCADALM